MGGENHTAHWIPKQTEYFGDEPRGDVIAFSHRLIDAGADLVLGHGPHVPRGLELYKGKLIVYSLGNFAFDYPGIAAHPHAPGFSIAIRLDGNGNFRAAQIDRYDLTAELDSRVLLPFFDRKTGLGTLRVYAEVIYGSDVYASGILRISRYAGEGYPGRLTEIFNLPYIYGSALLEEGTHGSADAREGADCAHFILYGKRREGMAIPYLNPKQVLPYLSLLDKFRGFRRGLAIGRHGPITLAPGRVEEGVLLHFGKHIAAVYANPDGSTWLHEKTLIIHQLEGLAEIVPFFKLAAKYKRIAIMTFRGPEVIASGTEITQERP